MLLLLYLLFANFQKLLLSCSLYFNFTSTSTSTQTSIDEHQCYSTFLERRNIFQIDAPKGAQTVLPSLEPELPHFDQYRKNLRHHQSLWAIIELSPLNRTASGGALCASNQTQRAELSLTLFLRRLEMEFLSRISVVRVKVCFLGLSIEPIS